MKKEEEEVEEVTKENYSLYFPNESVETHSDSASPPSVSCSQGGRPILHHLTRS